MINGYFKKSSLLCIFALQKTITSPFLLALVSNDVTTRLSAGCLSIRATQGNPWNPLSGANGFYGKAKDAI